MSTSGRGTWGRSQRRDDRSQKDVSQEDFNWQKKQQLIEKLLQLQQQKQPSQGHQGLLDMFEGPL